MGKRWYGGEFGMVLSRVGLSVGSGVGSGKASADEERESRAI